MESDVRNRMITSTVLNVPFRVVAARIRDVIPEVVFYFLRRSFTEARSSRLRLSASHFATLISKTHVQFGDDDDCSLRFKVSESSHYLELKFSAICKTAPHVIREIHTTIFLAAITQKDATFLQLSTKALPKSWSCDDPLDRFRTDCGILFNSVASCAILLSETDPAMSQNVAQFTSKITNLGNVRSRLKNAGKWVTLKQIVTWCFRPQERLVVDQAVAKIWKSHLASSAQLEAVLVTALPSVQVGGNHGGIVNLGMGVIAKVVKKIKLYRSEYRWYRAHEDQRIAEFMAFCFHGEDVLTSNGDRFGVLFLQDVTAFDSKDRPCCIDIKLGMRTHRESPLSSMPADRYVQKLRQIFGIGRQECSKFQYMEFRDNTSTSRRYGFRITEMSVAKYSSDNTCRGFFRLPAPNNGQGLAWYKALGAEVALIRSLVYFFHDGCQPQIEVMQDVKAQLDSLLRALQDEHLDVVGSSLLLTYTRQHTQAPIQARVTWIDFAHAHIRRDDDSNETGTMLASSTPVNLRIAIQSLHQYLALALSHLKSRDFSYESVALDEVQTST